ncbi:MAG: hypothetical protein FJY10_05725 [Bacteroidetes bacterium]|nr:hypothetical protein [Bacteroidota bacterium]
MKTIVKFAIALLLLASVQGFSQKGYYFGAGGNLTTTWITKQNNYGLPELDYNIKMGYGGALNLG